MRVHASFMAITFLASGCSTQDAAPKEESLPTVHEMMVMRIDPDADAIWEIGNAALSDTASIDPAKLRAEDWIRLEQAAARMASHAKALETLDPLVVTRPGVKIADEGTEGAPTPAQIQVHLQHDTDVYRALANSLTMHATDLAAAAAIKDAPTAGRLINEMDGVCESCHLEFWYPEQRELMKQMGILPG